LTIRNAYTCADTANGLIMNMKQVVRRNFARFDGVIFKQSAFTQILYSSNCFAEFKC